MDPEDKEHWSEFWQQGHITTFGESLADNYQGSVRKFWLQQFDQVPVDAVLLDIATGNGAVATLAVEFASSRDRTWQVHGCDLAHIRESIWQDTHPENYKLRSQIKFHSGVPIESLPFPDQHFDLISSQFGFEYCDHEQGLLEIFRVLKQGGQFSAICHHSQSSTLVSSQTELAAYMLALDTHKLFEQTARYIAQQSQPSPDTDRQAARLELNKGMNDLQQRFGDNPCGSQLLKALISTVSGASSRELTEVLSQLDQHNREFHAGYQRLRDLVSAALSESDMALLGKSFKHVGFSRVDIAQLRSASDEIIGHQLVATR